MSKGYKLGFIVIFLVFGLICISSPPESMHATLQNVLGAIFVISAIGILATVPEK